MEVILVLLRRADTVVPLLNAARCLTTLLKGTCIHVLAVRQRAQVPLLGVQVLMSEADPFAHKKQQETERLITLKATFEGWVQHLDEPLPATRWIELDGSMATIVEERGRRADIIVTGRPTLDDDRVVRQAFRVALFATDRPVLVVPPRDGKEIFGRRVAIAWRDEKRANKAVIPALRFLAGAEQVHVLIGAHDRAAHPSLPRVVVEHGIRAQLHIVPVGSFSVGAILLDKVHELGADSLVMGAYYHTPLRELILGGVTRYMLAHADLPVLMRH